MKAMINYTKPSKTYPYLGINKDEDRALIVLFTARLEGILLYENTKNRTIGTHHTNWLEDDFKVFTGQLILSND